MHQFPDLVAIGLIQTIFQAAIDFRDLGLDPVLASVGPVTLFGREIGPFSLRWYSLSYIAGIAAAWWLLIRMTRRPGTPATAAHIDDFMAWAAFGVIIGGRLGYVLFYSNEDYAADPLALIKLWEGGMAFHGGLVGVVVALWWFSRRNGIEWLRFLDYIAVVSPIGLFLGRCANFVNGELYGRATGADYGVIFPDGGPLPRHPSQLYEAGLEGLLLFAVLWVLFTRTDARMRPGLLAGVFGLGYGCARFTVEFFREPDVQLAQFALSSGLSMGQWLSLPLILGGLGLIATSGGRARAAA